MTIKPVIGAPLPKLAVGEWYDLRAELRGAELTLAADGATVWRGTLPTGVNEFYGPSGIRTENARFEFEFLADAGPSHAPTAARCDTGPAD